MRRKTNLGSADVDDCCGEGTGKGASYIGDAHGSGTGHVYGSVSAVILRQIGSRGGITAGFTNGSGRSVSYWNDFYEFENGHGQSRI